MNENPYRPPNNLANAIRQETINVPRSDGGSISFRLVDVQKTWFTRTAKFEGDFSGTLKYDCRGFNSETVYVDTKRITIPAESLFTLDLVKPKIKFEFKCEDERIPVLMEVKCSNLLFYITRFKLTVCDKLLYIEN